MTGVARWRAPYYNPSMQMDGYFPYVISAWLTAAGVLGALAAWSAAQFFRRRRLLWSLEGKSAANPLPQAGEGA